MNQKRPALGHLQARVAINDKWVKLSPAIGYTAKDRALDGIGPRLVTNGATGHSSVWKSSRAPGSRLEARRGPAGADPGRRAAWY